MTRVCPACLESRRGVRQRLTLVHANGATRAALVCARCYRGAARIAVGRDFTVCTACNVRLRAATLCGPCAARLVPVADRLLHRAGIGGASFGPVGDDDSRQLQIPGAKSG